ncbi:hypothetical protein PC111_g23718 [Phytophthora cactorum]|nr:hypothetical protein PC111_g23718 [Phytophthora cactorum]
MQEVALTGGEEEELLEFNTDSEVPQMHAPENTMTEGPVHEQQNEPEQLQTPVVIPLEEDTSDVQPVDRPFRDKHYSYPYVRIIERRRNGFKDFTVRSVVITTDRLNAAGGIKLQVRSIADKPSGYRPSRSPVCK